jgi:hypothetical protein
MACKPCCALAGKIDPARAGRMKNERTTDKEEGMGIKQWI